MEVSFVVPIYNSKKYLEECVDSLTKQNGIFEILLVDNGSKDGSMELAKELASKDKRIKVYKCEAPGAGAARNYGLKRAKGKYVFFVDSDDYIVPQALEKLLKKAYEKDRDGADIVMMSAVEIFENDKEKKIKLTAVSEKEKDYKHKFVRYGAGPWQFLLKREFLTKNKLEFHEGIIHEDMAIISAYILYTDKYTSIDEELYYYRQREDSVLHQTKWNPHCKDIFAALKDLYGRFAREGKLAEYKADIEYFFIWNLLSDSARDFMKFAEGKKEMPKMRKFLYGHFPNWRKNKYYKEKPFMVRLRCELNYRGVKI